MIIAVGKMKKSSSPLDHPFSLEAVRSDGKENKRIFTRISSYIGLFVFYV